MPRLNVQGKLLMQFHIHCVNFELFHFYINILLLRVRVLRSESGLEIQTNKTKFVPSASSHPCGGYRYFTIVQYVKHQCCSWVGWNRKLGICNLNPPGEIKETSLHKNKFLKLKFEGGTEIFLMHKEKAFHREERANAKDQRWQKFWKIIYLAQHWCDRKIIK